MKTTERISQIDARVAEIERGAEGARRNFNAEEMAELNELARERTLLSLQLRGGREANAAINEGNSYLVERQSVAEVIREAVRDNRQMQLVVRAEGDGGGSQTPATPTDNTIKKAVAAQASWDFANSAGTIPGGVQRAFSLDSLLAPITILGEGGDA